MVILQRQTCGKQLPFSNDAQRTEHQRSRFREEFQKLSETGGHHAELLTPLSAEQFRQKMSDERNGHLHFKQDPGAFQRHCYRKSLSGSDK